MNRAAFVPLAAAVALSCGTFLAASNEGTTPDTGGPSPTDDAAADVATTADGTGGPIDGAASGPMPPPTCPLAKCEDLPMGDQGCSDDSCKDSFDWAPTGNVQISNLTCNAVAASGDVSFTSQDRNPTGSRRYAVVSLFVVGAKVDGRAIASVHVKNEPDSERFEAVVRGGKLLLCERAAGIETCTNGVPFIPPAKVHLYGVVSTSDPPNASFALAVDTCTTPQVLPLTRPFPTADVVEGSVGCLDGPNACDVSYSSSVIYVVDQ